MTQQFSRTMCLFAVCLQRCEIDYKTKPSLKKKWKKIKFLFSYSRFSFSISLFCVIAFVLPKKTTHEQIKSKQIRVVNAFRQGLDSRYGEHSTTSLAEVLRKQTSLSKRLSQASSIEYADNIPDELTIPEVDIERLSSHSHTETAV